MYLNNRIITKIKHEVDIGMETVIFLRVLPGKGIDLTFEDTDYEVRRHRTIGTNLKII